MTNTQTIMSTSESSTDLGGKRIVARRVNGLGIMSDPPSSDQSREILAGMNTLSHEVHALKEKHSRDQTVRCN